MNKKIATQIMLTLIVVLIMAIIFFRYFYNEDSKNKLISDVEKISENTSEMNDINDIIKEIHYKSSDTRGNLYEIKSETGEIDPSEPSIILMTNVKAKIIFSNFEVIYIKSDYAKYNNENYNTNFFNNVDSTYLKHNIKSQNMTLSIQKNLASMSNDVIYTNFNTILLADKVEIDLITKNSKIFMNEKDKNIVIKKN